MCRDHLFRRRVSASGSGSQVFPRVRCKYLDMYRNLTGDTGPPPLPVKALEDAAIVEYSIKLRKGKPCQTRRLFVKIDDRDTFLKRVPSRKLRDWVQQKPIQQTYMMGRDGEKLKVYWTYPSSGGIKGGQSYGTDEEVREYKKASINTFPLSISYLSQYLTPHSSHFRHTPGNEKERVYYVKFNRGSVKLDTPTRSALCEYARREGYPDCHIRELEHWLEKAHQLHMEPSWLQVQPNEQLTVYIRLPEDL